MTSPEKYSPVHQPARLSKEAFSTWTAAIKDTEQQNTNPAVRQAQEAEVAHFFQAAGFDPSTKKTFFKYAS